MGWKGRGFYLDPAHVAYLFDTNANAGPTAWWHGRTVGSWVQEPDGVVQVVTLPGEMSEPMGARRWRPRRPG